jgi:hypothetical protein
MLGVCFSTVLGGRVSTEKQGLSSAQRFFKVPDIMVTLVPSAAAI